MSEPDSVEQGRGSDDGAGAQDDGFPGPDVAPEEPDPDLDVDDPFGVGEDREPLEPGVPDGSDEGDHPDD